MWGGLRNFGAHEPCQKVLGRHSALSRNHIQCSGLCPRNPETNHVWGGSGRRHPISFQVYSAPRVLGPLHSPPAQHVSPGRSGEGWEDLSLAFPTLGPCQACFSAPRSPKPSSGGQPGAKRPPSPGSPAFSVCSPASPPARLPASERGRGGARGHQLLPSTSPSPLQTSA